MRTLSILKSLSLAALFALSTTACAVDDAALEDMNTESAESQWMDWQQDSLDPGIDRDGSDEAKTPPRKPLAPLDEHVKHTSVREVEPETTLDELYCEYHDECESNLCDQRINRCYVPRF